MPARLASMELESSPVPDISTAETGSGRRRSGRVVKKPARIDQSTATTLHTTAGKRKRSALAKDVNSTNEDENTNESGEEDDNESEEDEDSASGPDEQEVLETRRRAKRGLGKNAAKRPKTNGNTNTLAIRPAKQQVATKSLTRARRPQDPAAEEVGGLYADVFARGEPIDNVTAAWLTRFSQHQQQAMTEIVNFVLKCAGCGIEVEVTDIEDPDNCATKLTEIQEEFQSQNIFEYPLIAKNRSAVQFKRSLTAFCNSLIKSIAQAQLLYKDPELIENIQVWVSTMSSAGSRPFRHTATVIALSIVSALAEIGKSLVDSRAATIRQTEGEQKKKRINQARVKDLQKQAQDAAEKAREVDSVIRDWFDTVFVHRYRDVDPRIRVECVSFLSDWIFIYPPLFFDGQHLRYLGWVLGDTHAPTRLEVVKNLQKIYREDSNIGGLRQFTERFRPRMVEMASQDAEVHVRVSAIELLDILREAGLLEPDDIDTIGRLIYDSEPRIRRAVSTFFVASVDETHSAKIDELGGISALEDVFPTDSAAADSQLPQLAWLKLKCLAELLLSFDPEGGNFSHENSSGTISAYDTLTASGIESRVSLVVDAFLDNMPELKDWEILAGYLLYDHSSENRRSSRTQGDVRLLFLSKCMLEEKEEILLLHLLGTAVHTSLAQVSDMTIGNIGQKVKKPRAQIQEEKEQQEAAAHRFAQLMPLLLNKFGATSEGASAVLRLCRVLNFEAFQSLRQDSDTYSALLDDINRQIMSYDNFDVLSAAKDALIVVRSFEEPDEITNGKFQALWDDLIHNMARICNVAELAKRGSLPVAELESLVGIVFRISKLACVTDCTAALDSPIHPHQQRKASKGRASTSSESNQTVLSSLILLIARGAPVSSRTFHFSETETRLSISAMKCIFFYFVWRVQELHTALTSKPPKALSETHLQHLQSIRATTIDNILYVLQNIHGIQEIRLVAAGYLLDLHSMFAIVRSALEPNTTPSPALQQILSPIKLPISTEVLKVFTALEKNYATKSKRTLEAAPEDEPEESDSEIGSDSGSDLSPVPSDSNSSDYENDVVAEQAARQARRKERAILLAEEQLCVLASKIVFGIVAGFIDASVSSRDRQGVQIHKTEGPVRKRLVRNRAKLGLNFREIIATLDPPKAGKRAQHATSTRPKLQPVPAKAAILQKKKSDEVVIDDENESGEDNEDDEEGEVGLDVDGLKELTARGLVVDDMDDDDDDGDEETNEDAAMESVIGD